ncbi:hypothetical protein [Companilactobacillus mishanensis]|uniref:Yip1 domain-containing protein n=1 Tax=Companilactobacillus mishanensis TaxID=2486008 RepID=A0A5P0ZKC9_9LACO|nr:hypothetical protein [Companilactobacillus mishanensis]MQS53137.1 hypothetical protein [Companilactobacillus mishanensis]
MKSIFGFFDWYNHSLKRPSDIKYPGKSYPIISVLINVLLVAVSVTFIVTKVQESMARAMIGMTRMVSNNSAVHPPVPNPFLIFGILFASLLIAKLLYLVMAYLIKRWCIGKGKGFFHLFNSIVFRSNSMIIISIITALFVAFATPGSVLEMLRPWYLYTLLALFTLSNVIWQGSIIVTIVLDEGKAKFDKFYVAILALVSTTVVSFLISATAMIIIHNSQFF